MYKEAIDIPQEIMEEVFNFREKIGYDLRQRNILRRRLINTVYNPTERVSFIEPKIW